MPLAEVIRSAWRALTRNPMRSVLTMLGISIGVGAFICSVAVGEGASSQIEEQIHSLGDNTIWIEAGNRNVNGVRTGTHGTKSLMLGDAKAIQDQISLVGHVTPNVDMRVAMVARNRNWVGQVRGVSPEYLAVRNWAVTGGRMFAPDEVDYAAKVCVLGQTVVAQLFGDEDPVGETIRVLKIPCEVIGVLASKGQSAIGQDQDDVVLMPYTTVQRKIKGIYWLDDILCSAISPTVLGEAEDQISALLRERHHVTGDREPDFNLRHPADLVQAGAAAQRVMTLLLASIASVALLVGGIGIMNIMLVSVTERTREIGLRLAVGARGRDVQFQFLAEACTLSVVGGVVGVGFGLAASSSMAYLATWRIVIRPDAVTVALGFAAAVGISFGLYPARRAARLDPVEALNR